MKSGIFCVLLTAAMAGASDGTASTVRWFIYFVIVQKRINTKGSILFYFYLFYKTSIVNDIIQLQGT